MALAGKALSLERVAMLFANCHGADVTEYEGSGGPDQRYDTLCVVELRISQRSPTTARSVEPSLRGNATSLVGATRKTTPGTSPSLPRSSLATSTSSVWSMSAT